MDQGEKSCSTTTLSYDAYGSEPSSISDDAFIMFIGVIIIIIGGIITVSISIAGQSLYHTYFCIDKIEQATILGQELVEHHGAYGTRWYEYCNTILINDSSSTINSMELMTNFRPKDNITIRSTYRLSDMELLNTEYIKR